MNLADVLAEALGIDVVTEPWRAEAACKGVDPELFFVGRADTASGQPDRAAAKAVCRRCPVRTECLDHALAAGERHGIWGGLTELERKPLRPKRRRRAGAA